MSYVSPREAADYYKVSEETLRDWANKDKIKYIRTIGKHRRYFINENQNGKSYVYARVSSRKQEEDLQRQITYLQHRYRSHEVVKDIGSGVNFKRQGFKTILEQLFERNVKEVVVTSSDRWARLGAADFIWLFEYFGAKLTILKSKEIQSWSEELAEDLLEIVTVFTARYHGKRKYDNKKNKILSR
jgi:putative resolvase